MKGTGMLNTDSIHPTTESERSPLIQMTNAKETYFLNRQCVFLDRAQKSYAVGIQISQKLLYRRFQRVIRQSRIKQAALSGDQELERRLRDRGARKLDTDIGVDDFDLTDLLRKSREAFRADLINGGMGIKSASSADLRKPISSPLPLIRRGVTLAADSPAWKTNGKMFRCFPANLFTGQKDHDKTNNDKDDEDGKGDRDNDDAYNSEHEETRPVKQRSVLTELDGTGVLPFPPMPPRSSAGRREIAAKRTQALLGLQKNLNKSANYVEKINKFCNNFEQTDGSAFDYYASRLAKPSDNDIPAGNEEHKSEENCDGIDLQMKELSEQNEGQQLFSLPRQAFTNEEIRGWTTDGKLDLKLANPTFKQLTWNSTS